MDLYWKWCMISASNITIVGTIEFVLEGIEAILIVPPHVALEGTFENAYKDKYRQSK